MDRQRHWDAVYTQKTDQDLSWFEGRPDISLRMLDDAGLTKDSCVIDVGGGDSRLVDALIAKGLHCLAVLDVSGVAMRRAKNRLGPAAQVVRWIEADVTADWSSAPLDVWHDRAVFHFLVEADDRATYVTKMRNLLKPNGSAILATFDLNGPEKCSGLPVQRYSAESLARELGSGFRLANSIAYEHHTPWGSMQAFRYSRFIREA